MTLQETFLSSLEQLLQKVSALHFGSIELTSFSQFELDTKSTFEQVREKITKSNALLSDSIILEMMQNLMDLISEPVEHQHQQQQDNSTKETDESTPSSTKERIKAFIKWKRAQINASNLTEFLTTTAEADSCARLRAKKPNSSCSIQRAVVENWEGPLDRATSSSKATIDSEAEDPMTRHLVTSLAKAQPMQEEALIQERMQTIEQHMQIPQTSQNEDLWQRVKRVEDKIIEIETKYPFLAAYHFNYEQPQAQSQISSQESKAKSASSKAKNAKIIQDETYNKLVRIKRSLVG
jgi:hypothetical protein